MLCGRPITFGDKEQIEKINTEQQDIAKQEELSGVKLTGRVNKYLVEIKYTGTATVTVFAENKKQAEKIAEKIIPDEPDDIEMVEDSASAYYKF